MKKQQYAQFIVSMFMSVFFLIVVVRSQRYLHDYELKRINELGVFVAETERRKQILAVLIRQEEIYCDGIPWQEDSLFIRNHWDALHSIMFADTITLAMIDSFQHGNYFKINMRPDSNQRTIETETVRRNVAPSQERISL
jgi:hypothetical protein